MAALFGGKRDISLFRHVNRELMGNIISQECIFYKLKLNETKANMYGEMAGSKYYYPPIILTCLVEKGDQEYSIDDFGVQFTRNLEFRFLRDDLLSKLESINADFDKGTHFGANVVPQIGDILYYYNAYYEIDATVDNDHFVGKDPKYDYYPNPINPGLNNYGWDVSIICKAHYIEKDQTQLEKARING